MSFTPLGKRILLKRLEPIKQWGNIILPDSAQERSNEAIVVALGVGKDEDGNALSFTVKVDDVIILPPQGATEVTVDGEKCLIIKESEILGIVACSSPSLIS